MPQTRSPLFCVLCSTWLGSRPVTRTATSSTSCPTRWVDLQTWTCVSCLLVRTWGVFFSTFMLPFGGMLGRVDALQRASEVMAITPFLPSLWFCNPLSSCTCVFGLSARVWCVLICMTGCKGYSSLSAACSAVLSRGVTSQRQQLVISSAMRIMAACDVTCLISEVANSHCEGWC